MKYRFLSIVLYILMVPVVSSAARMDGAQLYEKYCSRCHLSLEKSERAGRRAKRIRSAIRTNIGGMGQLRHLTKKEVDAIAAALAKVKVK